MSPIWYLPRGAVWKATANASRIYLPSAGRSLALDAVKTQLLIGLANGSYRSHALPDDLAQLVRDGVLTSCAENARPLIINRAEPRLDYVVLRLTNACNLRCRHCFVASGQPEPDELSLAEITRLFESLATFEPLVVVLTGGEPFVRRDVFDIATRAAQYNLAVDISTNGLLLKPQMLERLRALPNLRYVIVSLEGPTASVHDYIRGTGNFDATVKLMQTLSKQGLAVSVNHCVTALNLQYLSDTIDLALDLGARSIHLAAVSESGRAREHWSEFALTPEQRHQVSLIALRKFLQTGQVLAGEAEREVSGLGEESSETHNCGVGRDWCMIYANGDVTPCRPVYASVGAMGNIRQQRFETIWRDSPLLNRLRAVHTAEIPRCAGCYWQNRCHGGCRARVYQATGSWTEAEAENHCRAFGQMNRQVDRILANHLGTSVQTDNS